MPRECIFAGMVNHETYLKDETGGRRFWPFAVGRIDIDALRRDREQLWAEARERFHARDSWWLDNDDLVQSATQEVEARYEGDPWDEKIAAFVSTMESVSVSDVLQFCFPIRTAAALK